MISNLTIREFRPQRRNEIQKIEIENRKGILLLNSFWYHHQRISNNTKERVSQKKKVENLEDLLFNCSGANHQGNSRDLTQTEKIATRTHRKTEREREREREDYPRASIGTSRSFTIARFSVCLSVCLSISPLRVSLFLQMPPHIFHNFQYYPKCPSSCVSPTNFTYMYIHVIHTYIDR